MFSKLCLETRIDEYFCNLGACVQLLSAVACRPRCVLGLAIKWISNHKQNDTKFWLCPWSYPGPDHQCRLFQTSKTPFTRYNRLATGCIV